LKAKPTIKIRRAQEADQKTIVAIFNEAVLAGIATDESQAVTVADRQDWFAQFDDRHPLWVVTIDGQVRGWCALEPFYPNHAYADSAEVAIYIHKQARRKGLGRALLNFVDQQIKGHLHFKTVVAYIYERNQPSQNLFTSCNYERWGHLPNISKVNGEYRELKIFGKNYPTA
jgi:L-amino acid N-acyltransferase YncA